MSVVLGYYEGINPSACIVDAGEIVAFVEEERLTRVKRAPWVFPVRAIQACLGQAGVSVQDVDTFAYPWDGPAYDDGRVQRFYDQHNSVYPPDGPTLSWQAANIGRNRSDAVKRRLRFALQRAIGVPASWQPVMAFVPHHRSHVSAALLGSGFDEALIVTIDGSGETSCTEVWQHDATGVHRLWNRSIPHSLGWFYAALTEFLGFDAYDGEYKVMGLAACGRARTELLTRLSSVLALPFDTCSYALERRFVHGPQHTYSDRFTDELVEHLGRTPRASGRELDDADADLAACGQELLERAVCRLVSYFVRKTGVANVCIGGGVGHNVKMNGRLLADGLVDRLWVCPYPNDSGTPVGAAIEVSRAGHEPVVRDPGVFLGPAYTAREIEIAVMSTGLTAERPASVPEAVATRLLEGRVVAWFIGRSEAGQRALGARSILGHPGRGEVAERINDIIKRRESWRPLCPSILEEDANKYVIGEGSPYMMVALPATPTAREDIPTVVHRDGTTRPQIVDERCPTEFRTLLRAFKRQTGLGALINTSMNRNGQPIVESPRDALEFFGGSAVDSLAIGPFVLDKPA